MSSKTTGFYKFLTPVLIVIIAFAGFSPADVQAQGAGKPVVAYATRSDATPALRDLPQIPSMPVVLGTIFEKPRKNLPNRQSNVGPTGTDPVLQTTAPAASAATVGANFEGINNVNGVLPPDTNGDIGPDHYIQMVNLSFAIYNRNGTKLYGPVNSNTLWQGFGGPCETTNDGDPVVLYDHLADRWLMTQFALPRFPRGPFYECLAVSQTPDPLGSWHRYEFQINSSKLNDYPKFGVWPDGYYMSINQFTCNPITCNWAGAGAVAFERDAMLAGQNARMVYFDLYNVDPNLGGMLPSDLDGPVPPAGAPNPFVQMDDNAWGYSPDQLQLWNFHVNWNDPSTSTFNFDKALTVSSFDSDMCGYARNCIPQPGGMKLDALSDRLMFRLQYRNFGTYETLVVNHTVDVNGSDRAGVRWYELRDSGSGWGINQQGTFSPDGANRWVGSVAMNSAGDMGLGYSVSSTSISPSIRFTGRLAGDPLNQMTQGEGTIINGSGYQTHSAGRWGDYAMMAVDPVDDCTFWFTTEYYNSVGTAPWQTRIGSFKLADCGAPTTGTLEGTVRDAANNSTISGATVTIGDGASTTTNGSGFYQFTNVTPNTYDVTATASGYNSSTVNGVTVTAGNTTTQDFALTGAAPTTGTLQGTVRDAANNSTISGATVTIVGGASTITNGSGFYQFTNVTPSTYDVTASASGYNSSTVSGVAVTAGSITTQDFALTPAGPSGTMHVSAIDMSYSKKGPNYTISIQVTIVDENGLPVSGATVDLSLDVPSGGTATGSGTTGSNGTVTFTYRSKNTGTYVATVTNVSHSSYTYDSGANVVSSASLQVP